MAKAKDESVVLDQPAPSENLPVSYEEQIAKELANVAQTIARPTSNKVSTKAKLFTFPSGESNPGPLRVIILDYIAYNQHYKGAYNPNVRQGPDCWALGRNVEQLTPSETVPKPYATDCTGCPKAEWGSAATGKGKACKNQRRLIMTDGQSGQILTIYVSPTGLKSFDGYVRNLAKQGMLPIQVLTDISFMPNEHYPTLQFEFVEKHGRLGELMALRADAQDVLFVEPEIRTPEAA